jgi:hypothetical protein
MKLSRPRFTVRRLMIVVAVVGSGLGFYRWVNTMREKATYLDFVARAYGLEARNHVSSTRFYRQIIESRRRPEALRSTGYQNEPLFSNDWGGRLTVGRQDECDVHARLPRDPDDEKDIAHLEALEKRERLRASFFSRLAAKYRRAANYPWLPIELDPIPPE